MRRQASPAPDKLARNGTEGSLKMDVIGDEASAPSVPIPDVPGERAHNLRIGRPLQVLALGALITLVGFLGGLYWSNLVVGWTVALTTLVALMAVAYVSTGYATRWLVLYNDYRLVRRHALMLAEQNAYQSGFIYTFKPPQGDVDRLLADCAYKVLTAHERKVKLYAKGSNDDGARVHTDPEAEAYRLKDAADKQKERVERDIKQSLENFRRARDLAKAQGYTAHESWKDYISPDLLPRQLKQSKPGAVFAEGRNEPAFEGLERDDNNVPVTTREPQASGPQHAD